MLSNMLLAVIVFGILLAVAVFGYTVSHRSAARNNASRHDRRPPPEATPGGPQPY
jgi:fructose-specific phosphotransferase system IIC component